jgi:hypothetical protein
MMQVKKKKINKRGYPVQKRILFEADPTLRKMLLELQKFYLFKTRNRLFPYIILMAVFDIAALKENKKWTKRQHESWLYCRSVAESFDKSLFLVSAKRVLNRAKKEKPNSKMTLKQLSTKAKKELKNINVSKSKS